VGARAGFGLAGERAGDPFSPHEGASVAKREEFFRALWLAPEPPPAVLALYFDPAFLVLKKNRKGKTSDREQICVPMTGFVLATNLFGNSKKRKNRKGKMWSNYKGERNSGWGKKKP